MEPQDESEHNGFEDYDDGHDSDIESRLYAEIHYSNTIIGEENNSETTIRPTGGDLHKTKDCCDSSSNMTQTYLTTRVTQNPENYKSNTSNIEGIPKSNLNPQSQDKFINPNKRCSKSNEQDKYSKSSKKCKKNNVTDSNTNQQESEVISKNSEDRIVNPYNKEVINNTHINVSPLDPRFLNIFFGKKTNKNKLERMLQGSKRKRKKEVQMNKQKSSDKSDMARKLTAENKLSKAETIIDISSESSKDSLEDTSKYTAVKATDEKLKPKESQCNNKNSDSDSDEESIYEVPIPPKPAPPVIELKDSDAESESDSDSNEDSFLNESLKVTIDESDTTINTTLNCTMNNTFKPTLDSTSNTTVNPTLSKTNEISNIDSDSQNSNNIVLNCTEVQRGVASLDEIKRLSHPEPENSNTNDDVCNSANLQIVENRCGDSSIKKVVNTLNDKQKRKTVDRKNMPLEEYFFSPMTRKMKSFYNESWGGENFDLELLRSNMSRDPKKWTILNTDLVLNGPRRKRYFGMMCGICQKEGHRQNDCIEKFKNPTCHMCGDKGHFVTACPYAQCLSCGRKQAMYRATCIHCKRMFCNRCQSEGHVETSCPDLWRRYHNTISDSHPQIPTNEKNIMKPQHTLYCCNCAKQGHESAFCRKFRWSQHAPNPPNIMSYHGPAYLSEGVIPLRNVNNSNDRLFNQNDDSQRFNPIMGNNESFRYNSNARNDESFRFDFNSTASTSIDQVPLSQYDRTRSGTSIFKISSKNISETTKFSMEKLTLKVPKENGLYSLENWIHLHKFLTILAKKTTVNITLEEKSKKFIMTLQCTGKYPTPLTKLIKQYASRTSLERSKMYLVFDRNCVNIINHLDTKLIELNALKDDPLQLYEEIKHLNKTQTNDGLSIVQRKLSMLLHREGFIDDSLKELKNLSNKIKKSTRTVRKPKKYIPLDKTLISFKQLFYYLFYYNNIFVPYQVQNLPEIIEKYKAHVNRCESLRNNPILFPPISNVTATSNQAIIIEPLSSYNISQETQSTHNTLQGPSHTELDVFTNDEMASTSEYTSNLKINTTNSRKKPHSLYRSFMNSQNEEDAKKHERQFNNFIKKTEALLKKAEKINSPRLQHLMNIVKSQITENRIYVQQDPINRLRALVRKEMKRRKREMVSTKRCKHM